MNRRKLIGTIVSTVHGKLRNVNTTCINSVAMILCCHVATRRAQVDYGLVHACGRRKQKAQSHIQEEDSGPTLKETSKNMPAQKKQSGLERLGRTCDHNEPRITREVMMIDCATKRKRPRRNQNENGSY